MANKVNGLVKALEVANKETITAKKRGGDLMAMYTKSQKELHSIEKTLKNAEGLHNEKLPDAEAQFRASIEMNRALYGKGPHAHIVASLKQLGGVLKGRGKLPKAMGK